MRAHLRSNLVGYVALFIALGGTSYAAIKLPANSVGTKQIKRNAVTSAKLKRNAVDTSKVRNGTLLAEDFKVGQLPAGAAGLKGDPGPKGDPGAKGDQGPTGPAGVDGEDGTDFAYARTIVVNATQNLKTIVDGISDASASNRYLVKLEPGRYELGSQTLTMDAYIDLEGSGAATTTLAFTGTPTTGLRRYGPGEARSLRVDFTSSVSDTQPSAVGVVDGVLRDLVIEAEFTGARGSGINAGDKVHVENTLVETSGTAPTAGGAVAFASGDQTTDMTIFNSILRAEAGLDSNDTASGLNISGTLRVLNSIIHSKIHIGGQIAYGVTAHPTAKVVITGSEVIPATDGAGSVVGAAEGAGGTLAIANSVLVGSPIGSPSCIFTTKPDFATTVSAGCG